MAKGDLVGTAAAFQISHPSVPKFTSAANPQLLAAAHAQLAKTSAPHG